MLNRRLFLCLAPGAFVLAQSGEVWSAARHAVPWRRPSGRPSKALAGLTQKANAFGMASKKSLLNGNVSDDYDAILPRLVDLIASLQDRQAADPKKSAAIANVLNAATELLGALTSAERSPPPGEQEKALKVYSFEELRDDYLAQYDRCETRSERADSVAWQVDTLLTPRNRSQYEAVGQQLGIPWYFIGAIHSLEAGFNFSAHLHNGDPLRRRTVQVPAGRPKIWNPPTDWAASAADALTMLHFDGQSDWSLAQMLYRLEKYNGFGSRRHGIETPYLWSFSNVYEKGKYVRDGVWDPKAVSRQCGAGVIMKALIAKGAVTAPARTA